MSSYDVSAHAIPFLSLTGDNETRYASPAVLPPLPSSNVVDRSNLTLSVIVILTAFAIARFFWGSFIHLNAFSGPRWAILSNWWYFKRLSSGTQQTAFHEASQKFGTIISGHTGHSMMTNKAQVNSYALDRIAYCVRMSTFCDPCSE